MGVARWSLTDAVSHLRDLATLDDTADQAEHLAEHLRLYGDPECCVHGLPMRHPTGLATGASCRYWAEVDQVVAWARRLDALELGLEAAWQRRSPARWVVETLADVVPAGSVSLMEGDPPRLRPAGARQLVELAGTKLLEAGAVHPALVWTRGLGSGLAVVSETVTGLYVAHVADEGGRGERTQRYTCDVCGRLYRPKRPVRQHETPYCQRDACQRTRKRRDKARSRARGMESD